MGDLIDDDVIESFLSGGGGGELHTVQDVLRFAVTEFSKVGLVFGQGTMDALDEAHLLILLELKLPLCSTAELLSKWGSARLTAAEVAALRKLIQKRVTDKIPVAYLCKGCYFQGEQLYIDSRALIPRSHIGELLSPQSKHCLFPQSRRGAGGKPQKQQQQPAGLSLANVRSVLDLCTGSGALAIAAHRLLHHAQHAQQAEGAQQEERGEREDREERTRQDVIVHATDVSGDALEVARINLERKGLTDSISLFRGDLYAALPSGPAGPAGTAGTAMASTQYDLIVCNPPYVDSAAMRRLPAEYRHEPSLALDGGAQGVDLVRRILNGASERLTEQGLLVMEVGAAGKHVSAAMARAAPPASGARSAYWARTSNSSREVCVMGREAAEAVAKLLR